MAFRFCYRFVAISCFCIALITLIIFMSNNAQYGIYTNKKKSNNEIEQNFEDLKLSEREDSKTNDISWNTIFEHPYKKIEKEPNNSQSEILNPHLKDEFSNYFSYENDSEKTAFRSETMEIQLTIGQHVLERLREQIKCDNQLLKRRISQHGRFRVLQNYVMAECRHKCYESVTYTTHGEFSFLDNLVPIIERWNGPISVSVYAPGDDFNRTLLSFGYLRKCTTPLVQQFVTLHIFFEGRHFPKQIPKPSELSSLFDNIDCSITPPYFQISPDDTYRKQHELEYPINVARNIARDAAQTYFVLPLDIELYPSPNLIPKFLEMIARNNSDALARQNLRVFVLPVFQVSPISNVPETKGELVKMLKRGEAISFHRYICGSCHNIPYAKEWENTAETVDLDIFYIAKRTGLYGHWEPFYIGTKDDPSYEESITWEGKNDKMIQAFTMCIQDYDFMILNNAFICHKPGVTKKLSVGEHWQKTVQYIKKYLMPNLRILYGDRPDCIL